MFQRVKTGFLDWNDWLSGARRRSGWVLDNLTLSKAWNLVLCGMQFILRRPTPFGVPAVLKVDINANCNLRCTVCIHADPHGRPELTRQPLTVSRRMSVEQFASLASQVAGRTCAVSLYYLGDPLMHPDLDAICRTAAAAGLNSHVSTNFSFRFTDERLERLAGSGLTHLTVCVDGMTQETYSRTRVGGKLDLVLDNLRRLLEIRRREGRRYPRVEVQFIMFQHNAHELDAARDACHALGVDSFTHFWGALHNYTDTNPERIQVRAPRPARLLPHCLWPFFAMQIKYDGSVIPCCMHRQGVQYDPSGDARPVGNVFEASIEEVWHARAYRDVRAVVVDPVRSSRAGLGDATFCHGCGVVYETDALRLTKPADTDRWEDHYMRVPRGVAPRRLSLPLAQLDGSAGGEEPPRCDHAGRTTQVS